MPRSGGESDSAWEAHRTQAPARRLGLAEVKGALLRCPLRLPPPVPPMNHDAELDLLHAQSADIAAAQRPLLIALALAVVAVVGLATSSPLLGIVGWFGGLLVGIYAISRGAAAIELPALAKYPAMIATFVPGFCALATGGVWWLSRNAASANAEAITRVERSARLAAQRPAAAPATAATPQRVPAAAPAVTGTPAMPSPMPEKAFPAVRAVLGTAVAEGAALSMTPGIPRPEGMSEADFQTMLKASGPVARATLGHFVVVYRMDNGDNWLYVDEQAREKSGLTRDGLHRKALQNLMAIVKRPGQLRQVDHPPYLGFLLDGEHESSLVLVDEIWKAVLRNDCPNGAVVAIPARDLCMFCDADSPEGIIALREMGAKFRGQPGFVSDQLLLYTAQGWSAFR